MMPQIAILAYIFLGESLNAKEIIGLLLVGLGVLVVQLKTKSAITRVRQEKIP
jgi:uncharacterized membrane protein